MLVGGVNDSLAQAEKFKSLVEKIKPDKIQLNIPVRPTDVKISLPNLKRLQQIRNILSESAEVVSTFSPKIKVSQDSRDLERKVLGFLKARPATLGDFSNSLGLNPADIKKSVNSLVKRNSVKKRLYKGKMYFVRND